MNNISTNTVWHNAVINRQHREKQNKHKSVIVWFTGLSGSGKSTIAHTLEEKLHKMGCHTFVLDGDNVRHGLCGDLAFTDQDRVENIRRVGEVAKLFMEAGMIVLTAFISPFKNDRETVRSMVGENDFIEVYCDSAIEVCESRDIKGLYKKARAGEIKDFTGISSPYEEPKTPELIVHSGMDSLEDCVQKVLEEMIGRGIVDNAQ